MLEGVKGSEGAKQLASDVTTTGTKRPVDEPLDNPTVTKTHSTLLATHREQGVSSSHRTR